MIEKDVELTQDDEKSQRASLIPNSTITPHILRILIFAQNLREVSHHSN
jgi:hypothetical protein